MKSFKDVKASDNNGTASDDDPQYLIGVRFVLDIEIADSMMELREAVEQQLINEARNGQINQP